MTKIILVEIVERIWNGGVEEVVKILANFYAAKMPSVSKQKTGEIVISSDLFWNKVMIVTAPIIKVQFAFIKVVNNQSFKDLEFGPVDVVRAICVKIAAELSLPNEVVLRAARWPKRPEIGGRIVVGSRLMLLAVRETEVCTINISQSEMEKDSADHKVITMSLIEMVEQVFGNGVKVIVNTFANFYSKIDSCHKGQVICSDLFWNKVMGVTALVLKEQFEFIKKPGTHSFQNLEFGPTEVVMAICEKIATELSLGHEMVMKAACWPERPDIGTSVFGAIQLLNVSRQINDCNITVSLEEMQEDLKQREKKRKVHFEEVEKEEEKKKREKKLRFRESLSVRETFRVISKGPETEGVYAPRHKYPMPDEEGVDEEGE